MATEKPTETHIVQCIEDDDTCAQAVRMTSRMSDTHVRIRIIDADGRHSVAMSLADAGAFAVSLSEVADTGPSISAAVQLLAERGTMQAQIQALTEARDLALGRLENIREMLDVGTDGEILERISERAERAGSFGVTLAETQRTCGEANTRAHALQELVKAARAALDMPAHTLQELVKATRAALDMPAHTVDAYIPQAVTAMATKLEGQLDHADKGIKYEQILSKILGSVSGWVWSPQDYDGLPAAVERVKDERWEAKQQATNLGHDADTRKRLMGQLREAAGFASGTATHDVVRSKITALRMYAREVAQALGYQGDLDDHRRGSLAKIQVLMSQNTAEGSGSMFRQLLRDTQAALNDAWGADELRDVPGAVKRLIEDRNERQEKDERHTVLDEQSELHRALGARGCMMHSEALEKIGKLRMRLATLEASATVDRVGEMREQSESRRAKLNAIYKALGARDGMAHGVAVERIGKLRDDGVRQTLSIAELQQKRDQLLRNLKQIRQLTPLPDGTHGKSPA